MKRFSLGVTLILALLFSAQAAVSSGGEFLSPEEINSIRDAEDGGKRVLLYLQFAQRRLDAVRQKALIKDAGAGEVIQANLEEYTSILDALSESLESARKQRAPLAKPIQEMQKQVADFLKYLQELAAAPAPDRDDYQLTLEEAIDTTKDELANAKKGAFPEVNERKPPTDLPASPPPPQKERPKEGKSGSEEGPPRKPGRSAPKNP